MIRIYTLTDPRTNQIFYVGASKTSDKSLESRHLSWGLGTRGQLRQLKMRPIVETLDEAATPEEAAILETYWIWQIKSWGFQIENKRMFSGYLGSSRAMYSAYWWNWYREKNRA